MVKGNTDYEDCLNYYHRHYYRHYDNFIKLVIFHILPKLLLRICSKQELWSQRNGWC
jgi:predicted transglutaminase-like protease